MNRIIILIAVSFFSIASLGQVPRLFTAIQLDTIGIVPTQAFSAAFKARANVTALLSSANDQFIVDLPGSDTIRILRKKIEVKGVNRLTWYGIIKNQPHSLVILSVNGDFLEGRIMPRNGPTYIIRYIGNQLHQVGKVRPGYSQSLTNDQRLMPPGPPPPPMPVCGDPINVVDVMVLFTTASLNGNPASTMLTRIDNHMAFTNTSFINSNIDLHFNLVRAEEISYNETGSKLADLDNLENGTIPNVHTLRDTYKADLVLLIVNTLDDCGFADVLSDVSSNNYPRAFCIVKQSCLVTDYVFTHELGHLAYARHNWEQDGTDMAPYAYNHGSLLAYTAGGIPLSYRTIMSYNNCSTGACIQELYWSNPEMNYPPAMPQRISLGSDTTNNARTLDLTKHVISGYRCRTHGADKVWMRDTNNDSGLEPDPATATEQMFRSPYIWVRNNRDDINGTPSYPNQFRHENPASATRNWIYVMLHNNGPQISGHLMVYYASASTRLEWPADWTLIKDTALAFSSMVSEIVEIPWETPGVTGHYCMVARWVSGDDPMGFAETTDINYNTRRSNNIIWRNLNIVAMAGIMSAEVFLMVQQLYEGDAITLEFNDPANFPKTAFTESGRIYIIPDAIFLKHWKTGGRQSQGLKFDGTKFQVISTNARISNVNLPGKYKAKLKIVFEKTEATPEDKFEFNIKHFEGKKKNPVLRGGIAYEILNYQRLEFK